ncbi:response regulator transcription factor [Bariatricus massiliensis]|uniref:Stage 0 sporulation protein A homolog n=1 Tax=Bariatricus massiliensis TaxID=1745713 RepID=A0ABS8DEN6_9FIRM|nr:response regulator transcription factor [Bariatricus massiliensis]MCB7302987.1 response regulator transcription factor [Bariatricus massiliensis]MCB7374203.1 response regulator transcription factor [Bariatricus massiliensis]MCB7386873.1 response regulator transcription factor [Bariatricus massiliensis]MCB7411035.1 response regulator transcription factor [Bariatricus massiliensis]MCQ5251861.1 response regulator transcription factor [Bariatricus massiliensis]
MERIFIVEDEPRLREELGSVLEKNGYECILAEQFEQITEDIVKAAPDLVLLDLGLPVYDGFYICRKLRQVSEVPVIVVTSSDSDMDELMSLNLGADDFITKPYNIHILLAHIAAVLVRSHGRKGSLMMTHKGLTLDIGKSRAVHKEQSVDLTKNELGILRCLMEHKGTIVSRDELIQELWEMEEFVEDSTLTVNINRLRKKLADVGISDYLTTKRGQGYMV